MKLKRLDPKFRIKNLSKIDPETGCWNWLGTTKGREPLKQYGSIVVGSRRDSTRKTISAHRYSFMIFKGEIPNNLWVLHTCDNPKCVNPDHLFLGTRQDNVDDRERKGRNKPMCGEKNPHTVVTREQAQEIREIYAKGNVSQRELAKRYGFKTHTSIGAIINNKMWLPPKP